MRDAWAILVGILILAIIFVLVYNAGARNAGAGQEFTAMVFTIAREADTGGVAPAVTRVPTATPTIQAATPTKQATWPTHRALTRDEIGALALSAGFPAWEVPNVQRIAYCESTYRPWATGAVGEKGIMQLHPTYHQWRANLFGGDLYDPLVNMKAAHHLWQEQGWRPWSCR